VHGFVSKPKYDKCHLSVKDGNVVLYLKHVTASLPLFIVKHVISTPCSTISTTYRQIHCDSNNRTVIDFEPIPRRGDSRLTASLGLIQPRRQDLAAGEAKNQKGEPKTRRGGNILKMQHWMYVATLGPNVKWGDTDFKWEEPGTTGPPAGDGPGLITQFILLNASSATVWGLLHWNIHSLSFWLALSLLCDVS